jgi:hypothetical protein
MRKIALPLLLSFAACASADAGAAGHGSPGPRDWRLPTGLPPSQAEYEILVNACRDKARNDGGNDKSDEIDTCLSNEFGLQRNP